MQCASTASAQKDSIFVDSSQSTKTILLQPQMILRSSSSTNRAGFRFEQESVSPDPLNVSSSS